MLATYWLARRVSGTLILKITPFARGPVTATLLVVARVPENTRSPGSALTLVTPGPETVSRIAPSAPAFGVASDTESTPATGPIPSTQLPAATTASVTAS